MDSFELNKIAGAVLGSLLFVMTVGLASEAIWNDAKPAKPGYEIAVAETKPASGDVETPAVAVAPIADRLKVASAEDGKKVFAKCQSCHNVEKGGKNGIGPNMWNVVAGPKAHAAGFAYSTVMKEAGEKGAKWGFDELDKFLAGPQAYMKGTKMSFLGLAKPEDRAAVIAYLRSLSDNPVAMP
jgi:cytochrome c